MTHPSPRARARFLFPLALAAFASGASGCRGAVFTESPRQLFDDMDWQPKFLPEAQNDFFADHRAMRPLVEGTVAQGELREDLAFHEGIDAATGKPLGTAPVKVDAALLRRGEERFNVFCAPCHDRAGSGHGIVVQRGFHIPIDLASERVRAISDGEVFQAISRGVRNMPAYAVQIPEEDRWAIVTWVRVLGRSQHATVADVPAAERGRIEAPQPQGAK